MPDAISRPRDKASRMKMHGVRTLYRGQWDEPNLLNM